MNTQQPLPRELESTHYIRFQDCDPFGHLNNARYINYFMNAREDQIARHYGFSIFAVAQEQQKNWVVTRNQIAYLAPVGIMEEVRIITRLIRATDNILLVEGVMVDAARKRVKAVSWMEFTFVSLVNGRPIRHTDEMMELFRAVVLDEAETAEGFEPRVQALKAFYRRQHQQENGTPRTSVLPKTAESQV
ncbi:MAG: acyl-CoA thioesterase [Candidatus Promineifilaceae bacterium]